MVCWSGRRSPVSDGQLVNREYDENGAAYALRLVQFCSWNFGIDVFASLIIDQCQCCTCVDDGSVCGGVEGLIIDRVARRRHLPEAVGTVHMCVVNVAAGGFDSFLIDVTEGVERFTMVRVVNIVDAAEICREESMRYRCLSDHVLDGSVDWLWRHGVDLSL